MGPLQGIADPGLSKQLELDEDDRQLARVETDRAR